MGAKSACVPRQMSARNGRQKWGVAVTHKDVRRTDGNTERFGEFLMERDRAREVAIVGEDVQRRVPVVCNAASAVGQCGRKERVGKVALGAKCAVVRDLRVARAGGGGWRDGISTGWTWRQRTLVRETSIRVETLEVLAQSDDRTNHGPTGRGKLK